MSEMHVDEIIVDRWWRIPNGVTALYAQSILIKEDSQMDHAGNSLELIETEELILDDGASIDIGKNSNIIPTPENPSIKFSLIAKRSRFSDNTRISATCFNNRGQNLKIYLGVCVIEKLLISTAGYYGIDGVAGAKGDNGKDADFVRSAGDGWAGRPGGTGGSGFRGGDQLILMHVDSPFPKILECVSNGGPGGFGGPGGIGGDGGKGYQVLGQQTHSPGNPGANGPPGARGPEGAAGNVDRILVTEFNSFTDFKKAQD